MDWLKLFYPIVIAVIVFLCWNYPFIYPIKLLIVFFHESSHAIAVVVTGGEVRELVIVAEQGGHVLAAGGSQFWRSTSGYLGSLMWGVIIYGVAVTSHLDKWIMGVLAIAIATITLLYGNGSFTLFFGIITALAMLLSARYLNEKCNDFVLRAIGLTSMGYVPWDIYSDTIERSHLRSDAAILAENLGGSTIIWGSLWILISLVVIFFTLRWTMKKEAGHSRSEKS